MLLSRDEDFGDADYSSTPSASIPAVSPRFPARVSLILSSTTITPAIRVMEMKDLCMMR